MSAIVGPLSRNKWMTLHWPPHAATASSIQYSQKPELGTAHRVGRFPRKRRFDEQSRDAALSLAGTLDGQRQGDGRIGDRSPADTPVVSALLRPGLGLHGDSRTLESQVRVQDGL